MDKQWNDKSVKPEVDSLCWVDDYDAPFRFNGKGFIDLEDSTLIILLDGVKEWALATPPERVNQFDVEIKGSAKSEILQQKALLAEGIGALLEVMEGFKPEAKDYKSLLAFSTVLGQHRSRVSLLRGLLQEVQQEMDSILPDARENVARVWPVVKE